MHLRKGMPLPLQTVSRLVGGRKSSSGQRDESEAFDVVLPREPDVERDALSDDLVSEIEIPYAG